MIKLYAALVALLMLAGALPGVVTAPLNLVADGIAAIVTGVPWWLVALVALTVWAHRTVKKTNIRKPRIRVVRGTAYRKAA